MIDTSFDRQHCGSCDSDRLDVVLDLGSSPLANEFPLDPAEALPQFPLQLLQCGNCKLAQLGAVVPDELLWRGEYGYYSSTSPVLVDHMREYARWLARTPYAPADGDLIVEVGCNDGLLIGQLSEWLHTRPRIVGVDPAKGPAAAALARGFDVRVEHFGAAYADELADQIGRADIVIANNVAAHVADLHGFLSGLATMLSPTGALIMEVQYLPDLLVGNGFDMIYHEHRFFWTLETLIHALALHGLRVDGVKFVDTQGGSIRIVARHYRTVASSNAQGEPQLMAALSRERELYAAGRLSGLQFRADRIAQRLRELLRAVERDGTKVIGYGAPAKATTLLHWTKTAEYVSWMEDTTPAKHGRFMPGHAIPIPIRAPKPFAGADANPLPPSTFVYLLTAWNYAPYVLRRERDYMAQGGRFVLPLPAPTLI